MSNGFRGYDDWKGRSDRDEYPDWDPEEAAFASIRGEIDRMEREISALRDALHECMEYFHDEQDAWTEDGQWVSNKQMKLGVMVEKVLAKDYRR